MISELSIIIPTLNEQYYLPELLKSIVKQKFEGRLQVIVVDGQSKDKTVSVAKSFTNKISDLTVLEVERGTAYQRNRGAEKAKYKYLLFLDADIILPDKFLNRLASQTDPHENFIALALHLPIKPNFFDYLFVISMYAYVVVAQFYEPAVTGSFIYTTKKIHEKIHGFMEGAILGEDTDYGDRAIKAGAKYHLYLKEFVYGSPRRVRKMGRLRLMWFWTKSHMYIRKHGPITDPKLFPYVFGEHGKYLK